MNRLQNPPQALAQGANQVHASAQKGTLAVQEGELLAQELPPQVIRWTGWMLIAIFIVVALVSVLVHIPETVRCSFVLIPENGADPIQSPLLAVVQAVKVAEGQEVPQNAELFVLRSDEISAWQTQLQTSEEDLRTFQTRSVKLEEYYAAQLGIKSEEKQQAERDVAFRQKHLATSQDLVARNQKLADDKLVSEIEMIHRRLDLAESDKDLNFAERHVQQLTWQRQQLETERARLRADEQSEIDKLKVRIEAL